MLRLFRREYARVVYSSDYIYGLPSLGEHQTFDIMRFKKIRDRLVDEKLLNRRNILRPDPCTYDDIRLVHTEEYIRKIRDPQYISRILKLDTVNLLYNSIMEYFRVVTGGTLLATAYALKWNTPVFNLGGGYHHAHPDRAEGFCVINDVAIAIEKFRKLERGKKFMIIDLDYHQGNGNLLYFQDDDQVYTFSMHADTWVEIDRKNNKDILLPAGCDDEKYLAVLENELQDSCMEFRPDVVFYIAGSDIYEKDTLGDMRISREGVFKRNLYVYQRVRKKGIPLVVLAGGGYGPDSWEVYYDFIAYALRHKM
ncbi:MAG TPA: histone deacetylase [Caldithrix abyssi]|uniref:Histone deacetylase n=1 Tax=Caldithrix abyssi TaxID=187145 RepID=A0A7V5PP94_CALAY|nr:histone deacetylase [Caldithrix abyssi]